MQFFARPCNFQRTTAQLRPVNLLVCDFCERVFNERTISTFRPTQWRTTHIGAAIFAQRPARSHRCAARIFNSQLVSLDHQEPWRSTIKLFDLLAVSDEYNRREELAIFYVTTSPIANEIQKMKQSFRYDIILRYNSHTYSAFRELYPSSLTFRHTF